MGYRVKDRQDLLLEIHDALTRGIITASDLRQFNQDKQQDNISNLEKNDKLSSVDIMFYIAGIVLFSAIISFIVQSWSDVDRIVHITFSAGTGTVLWMAAYYIIRLPRRTDIQNGLTNALLLTGSLSIVVGGYIISNELIGGYDQLNYISGAVTFLTLGVIHIAYDRLIKRDIILLLGVLSAVLSFPMLMLGILGDTQITIDTFTCIILVTTGLLSYATRVVGKINTSRASKISTAFDPLAAFSALSAVYAASFGEYSALWLIALTAGILSIFYISIISQNKHLLGNASLFLVITVITISFKYFSGYGITTSLTLSALGLLGSAAIAANINKKYFTK
jgi:hypothetical protein